MRRNKKGLKRLLLAFAVASTLLVVSSTPSAALTNHTMTLQTGSVIAITGGRTFNLVGAPQCSDGINNDQDANTDFPADTDCTSAVDNNECQAGLQAVPAAPTLTFQDSGTGTLSNFVVTLPPADVCASTLIGQLCFRVGITVNTAGATGTLSSIVPNVSAHITAGAFSFTVAVSTCGYKNPPGFSATNCKVTFAGNTFSTLNPGGVQYLEAPRTATLTRLIPSGPSFGAGTCGSFLFQDYAGQLNTNLGLPNSVNVVLKGIVNPALSSV